MVFFLLLILIDKLMKKLQPPSCPIWLRYRAILWLEFQFFAQGNLSPMQENLQTVADIEDFKMCLITKGKSEISPLINTVLKD